MKEIGRISVVSVIVLLLFIALGPIGLAKAAPGHGAFVRIAGMSVTCTDFRGREVHTLRVNGLGDVARAWVVNHIPFIIMDRARLAKLPPKLQLFFYGHECAHHKLGHWMHMSMDNEREADCWSIREGRDKGLFTRDEVAAFAPWFANSRGSRYGHLPGPQRVKFLLSCFDNDDDFTIVYRKMQTRAKSAAVILRAHEYTGGRAVC